MTSRFLRAEMCGTQAKVKLVRSQLKTLQDFLKPTDVQLEDHGQLSQ